MFANSLIWYDLLITFLYASGQWINYSYTTCRVRLDTLICSEWTGSFTRDPLPIDKQLEYSHATLPILFHVAVGRITIIQGMKQLPTFEHEILESSQLTDAAINVFYNVSWRRHQLETFSALLAHCAGNSPVTAEFPAQRPVTRSFDVFFDLCPNKRLGKQSRGWWAETPSSPLWCHRNATDKK